MTEQEKVLEGLEEMLDESKYNDSVNWNPWADTETLEAAIALLKAQEPCEDAVSRLEAMFAVVDAVEGHKSVVNAIRNLPSVQPVPVARVMSMDLPEDEWHDKVIWLEIKGKKATPCLFRECSDRMMFGHYERLMYFDVVGSSRENGYMLKNYGVKWRCWTSRPTDAQREATPWQTQI